MDHANAWTRNVLGVHCIKLVKNKFFKNIQDICAVILISRTEGVIAWLFMLDRCLWRRWRPVGSGQWAVEGDGTSSSSKEVGKEWIGVSGWQWRGGGGSRQGRNPWIMVGTVVHAC
jgi:hypothetical protein